MTALEALLGERKAWDWIKRWGRNEGGWAWTNASLSWRDEEHEPLDAAVAAVYEWDAWIPEDDALSALMSMGLSSDTAPSVRARRPRPQH